MGHRTGKDIYKRLGRRIDGLSARAPWNETLRSILQELYTPAEADVVLKMPDGLHRIERIARITGYERPRLEKMLDGLCAKGLVIDLWINGAYHYTPSPVVVGFFEFTLMRTASGCDGRKMARLFHEYLFGDDAFFTANLGQGQQTAIARALPHEESLPPDGHVEVLDYEKATALIEYSDIAGVSVCSCRHLQRHTLDSACTVPLGICTSFGAAADYLIRHNLAKPVSRTEMLENLARAQETGLALLADNVQKNISFLCHCCKCCCTLLLGMRKHGYANTVVTSSVIALVDEAACTGCGRCVQACPVEAIRLPAHQTPASPGGAQPRISSAFCLGCGSCRLACPSGAFIMAHRPQRVIPPETMFERVILQCLEQGTLQNQLFSNPGSITHNALRALCGAFLRLAPVKKALLSRTLRSSFLAGMKKGAALTGRGWATRI